MMNYDLAQIYQHDKLENACQRRLARRATAKPNWFARMLNR